MNSYSVITRVYYLVQAFQLVRNDHCSVYAIGLLQISLDYTMANRNL
jgi:hypothetical protein